MTHRLLTSLLSVLLTAMAAASTVNINGKNYPVDTLENYQVGPGTHYSQFNITMGSTLHRMYLLTVDMTNPYVRLEECQGKGIIGQTELMTASHQRLDSAEHHPIGSVNCNFWVVQGNLTNNPEAVRIWSGLIGQPFSGTAHDGVLIGDPSENWNRGRGDSDLNHEVGFFIVDEAHRAFIDDMRYQGYVRVGEDTCFLRDCNRTRVNPDEHELVLFNHYIGKPTRTISNGAVEMVLRLNAPWAINHEIECEVMSVNSTGGTTIDPGYAVLQAHGLQALWLSKYKTGDKMMLNTVVQTRQDGIRKAIREMVTGNCLVLMNGQQTNRNTNESYNNQNYPRTMLATNDDGTTVWMLVSEKPGNYTSEMCSLLQNVGATYAIGMDGGGSAQMNLFGKIQNTTTEASPRAVANSLFVINTAPDDETVSSLSTMTPVIRLPRYAKQRIVVAAYNKYGTLLSRDYPVSYSCDSEVGYINDDGYFVCLGSGVVHATAGEAQTDIIVELQESQDPHFELDSVLLSSDTHYPIAIFSTVGNEQVRLANEGFSFAVADEEVCSVSEEGVVNGLKNGTTTITTTVDGQELSMRVRVEIPAAADSLLTAFYDTEGWTIKASTDKWNTRLLPPPAGSQEQSARLVFTYSTMRNANIRLSQDIRLYSLPRSLELRLNPADLVMDKLTILLTTAAENKETVVNMAPLSLTLNQTNSLVLSLDSLYPVPEKISAYPLIFNGLTLYPQNAVTGKEYELELIGLWAHYDGVSVSLPLLRDEHQLIAYPNPTNERLYISGVEQATTVLVYDMQGRVLGRRTIDSQDNSIDLTPLCAGEYVLRIGNQTITVVKKSEK